MQKLTTLEVRVFELKKGNPIGQRLATEDLISISIRIGSAGKAPVELSTDVIEKSNLIKLIGCLKGMVKLLEEEAQNQTY